MWDNIASVGSRCRTRDTEFSTVLINNEILSIGITNALRQPVNIHSRLG